AGTFLVAGLATLSLPGLAPFISEFLVLIGTFTRYPVFAVLAATPGNRRSGTVPRWRSRD
ncbi:hypothetical protein C6A85_15295, partial [Mycobacterium sp. ITM-2017-0098]